MSKHNSTTIHKKILLILLPALLIYFFSCQKFEEYPVIPHIEFNEFQVIKDINGSDSLGYLSISYTDGDGDIGLKSSDTLPPYEYNFFLDIYQNINGELEKVVLPDSNVTFNARIPILTPKGVHKAIKGTIEMELELFRMVPFLDSDTIAFETYIVDRALHESNVIMTPEFIVN